MKFVSFLLAHTMYTHVFFNMKANKIKQNSVKIVQIVLD